MTLQEIYNRVRDHLLTQNKKSEVLADYFGNQKLQCLYRGPDGLMCAVGCLISDEFYNKKFEGQAIRWGAGSALKALEASLGQELSSDQHDLLTALQYLHDARPVEEWRAELSMLAVHFKLQP